MSGVGKHETREGIVVCFKFLLYGTFKIFTICIELHVQVRFIMVLGIIYSIAFPFLISNKS